MTAAPFDTLKLSRQLRERAHINQVLTSLTLSVAITNGASALEVKKMPWLEKSQWELTRDECARVARHDSYYWWSKGKCHMKAIRYAFGVALRDTGDVQSGELVPGITQFRSKEGTYCIHGGGFIPVSDVKLIGSIVLPTPGYGDQLNSADDLEISGVRTSCELLMLDIKDVISAGAKEMLDGCKP